MNKEDVWADLMYAFGELNRPSLDTGGLLDLDILFDNINLDVQSECKFFNRFFRNGSPSISYGRAKARADARNAHEAIEKGLKAILLDAGWTNDQVRSRGHKLHQLLADVKQHKPTAFDDLNRCFKSTIQYLESVTNIPQTTDMETHFQKYGKEEIFVESRYESIEGKKENGGRMILLYYHEIIRALMSIIFGLTPEDICSRVEKEARKAVLAKSRLYPSWNVNEWLASGPVRARLEDMEALKGNKVLRSALRRCARESKDRAVERWADGIRRKYIASRKSADPL